jgi:hypothetical protein
MDRESSSTIQKENVFFFFLDGGTIPARINRAGVNIF